MIVEVKLFAITRQLVGRPTCSVELPASATVADLRRELSRQVAELVPVIKSLQFAVGTQYATDATVISPGDEIACIPPVSGG